jgi:hypothetical protein
MSDGSLLDRIKVGYIVDVPRGADDVCTTRHRVRVASIGSYGITGPRVRADLTPMVSSSALSEGRYVERTVPWAVVAKATIVEHEPRCVRCKTLPAPEGFCCSSHDKELCHGCYRQTHFVEICGETCTKCTREGLDPTTRVIKEIANA